jgi:hypothetical protein
MLRRAHPCFVRDAHCERYPSTASLCLQRCEHIFANVLHLHEHIVTALTNSLRIGNIELTGTLLLSVINGDPIDREKVVRLQLICHSLPPPTVITGMYEYDNRSTRSLDYSFHFRYIGGEKHAHKLCSTVGNIKMELFFHPRFRRKGATIALQCGDNVLRSIACDLWVLPRSSSNFKGDHFGGQHYFVPLLANSLRGSRLAIYYPDVILNRSCIMYVNSFLQPVKPTISEANFTRLTLDCYGHLSALRDAGYTLDCAFDWDVFAVIGSLNYSERNWDQYFDIVEAQQRIYREWKDLWEKLEEGGKNVWG